MLLKRLLPILLIILLCGCSLPSGETLLYPPQAPLEFKHLQKQVNKLLVDGVVYSPPVHGFNRQSIQTFDLTGDDDEEAIVFLRDTKDQSLKIHFFTKIDDEYEPMGVIAGGGDSIDVIEYFDLNGDGISEILVGWKIGDALKALTVYTFSEGKPSALLSTSYHEFVVLDITGDDYGDLLVVNVDSAKFRGTVEMYQYRDMNMEHTASVSLSSGVEMLRRVRTGALIDGFPALYVASQFNSNEIVTDIFVYRGNNLINISLNMETGISDETVRNYSIFAMDIDGDDILELPKTHMLPSYDPYEESGSFYEITWRNYDSFGRVNDVARTFQRRTGGWYLILPEKWYNRLTVITKDINVTTTTTTFALYNEGAQPTDLLVIHHITKKVGELLELGDGQILLSEKSDTALVGEILQDSGEAAITRQELKESFMLIQNEWITGVQR